MYTTIERWNMGIYDDEDRVAFADFIIKSRKEEEELKRIEREKYASLRNRPKDTRSS